MAKALHDIDRDFDADGDVLLVLQRPNSPFAVWSEHNDWKPFGFQFPEPQDVSNSLLEFRAVDPAWLKSTSTIPYDVSEPVEPVIFEPVEPLILEPEAAPTDDVPADVAPIEDAPAEDAPIEYAIAEDAPVEYNSVQAVTVEEKPLKYEAVEATSNQRSEIRFRLSSKHLVSASPVFKIMLDGNWKESALTSESYYTLDASEWDVEALQIIMDIIHGKGHRVPRSVTLELLAKLAILVDYYKCHDTVKFFSDTWIENLHTSSWKHTTAGLSRELILCLFISYVFNQAETIQELLYSLITEARGPLPTLDLPLPGSMIDSIDSRRQEAVKCIIDKYHDLMDYFMVRDSCSFECNSILLGSLVTSMVEQGLYNPLPAQPFHGYSLAELIRGLRNIKSPSWSKVTTILRRKHIPAHACSLNGFLEPFIEQLENDLKKLTLGDFGLKSMADSAS